MKFYGYTSDDESATLEELVEVTLCAGPDNLRSLAEFLLHVAEEMERHGDDFGHEHFADFVGRPLLKPGFVVARSGLTKAED